MQLLSPTSHGAEELSRKIKPFVVKPMVDFKDVNFERLMSEDSSSDDLSHNFGEPLVVGLIKMEVETRHRYR